MSENNAEWLRKLENMIKDVADTNEEFSAFVEAFPDIEEVNMITAGASDELAALRAQVAELRRELEQLRRDNKAITVAVKIAPEWQGNYAYDFDETLVIVDNEYQDGELFYQVVGRFGRGWIEASHLRLTT